MAGSNKGSVYTEAFGTSSPVSGSAPTSATDGQPIRGLTAVTVVVSCAAGATLSGSGTLTAYLYDSSIISPDGAALANGGSGLITSASLAYDGQSANFTVGLTVTGGTSGATGVIATDTDAGTTGTLTLTGIVGTFVDNETLTDSSTGAAVVNGVAFKLLPYDGQQVAFEVGQVVTGVTSAAVATIASLTSTVLTFNLSTVTGVFVDNEILNGVSPARWVPFIAGNLSVTGTGRDQAFAALTLLTPRNGRIKWVPTTVAFAGGGSGGVTVHQVGQTGTDLHDQGQWGG